MKGWQPKKGTGIGKEKGEGFRGEGDVKVDFTKEKECWVAVMGEAYRMGEESKPNRMLFHVTNDYYGDGFAPKDTWRNELSASINATRNPQLPVEIGLGNVITFRCNM